MKKDDEEEEDMPVTSGRDPSFNAQDSTSPPTEVDNVSVTRISALGKNNADCVGVDAPLGLSSNAEAGYHNNDSLGATSSSMPMASKVVVGTPKGRDDGSISGVLPGSSGDELVPLYGNISENSSSPSLGGSSAQKRVLTPVVVCGCPCSLSPQPLHPQRLESSPSNRYIVSGAEATESTGLLSGLSGSTRSSPTRPTGAFALRPLASQAVGLLRTAGAFSQPTSHGGLASSQAAVAPTESDKLGGLNEYVLRELRAPRPRATDIEAVACPPKIEPFRKAWWAGVRPATCERTCRHRSKVCDAIQLCNDCTGYYCKWLADLVGIPVLKASGRVDPLVFHTDPLAKLYWDRISKVLCCPKSTDKCLMCIRRYQLFTHFLPGNLLFRSLVHQSVMKLNEEGFAVDMGLIRKVTRRHLERIAESMGLRLPFEYYASLQAYDLILRRGPLVDVLASGVNAALANVPTSASGINREDTRHALSRRKGSLPQSPALNRPSHTHIEPTDDKANSYTNALFATSIMGLSPEEKHAARRFWNPPSNTVPQGYHQMSSPSGMINYRQTSPPLPSFGRNDSYGLNTKTTIQHFPVVVSPVCSPPSSSGVNGAHQKSSLNVPQSEQSIDGRDVKVSTVFPQPVNGAEMRNGTEDAGLHSYILKQMNTQKQSEDSYASLEAQGFLNTFFSALKCDFPQIEGDVAAFLTYVAGKANQGDTSILAPSVPVERELPKAEKMQDPQSKEGATSEENNRTLRSSEKGGEGGITTPRTTMAQNSCTTSVSVGGENPLPLPAAKLAEISEPCQEMQDSNTTQETVYEPQATCQSKRVLRVRKHLRRPAHFNEAIFYDDLEPRDSKRSGLLFSDTNEEEEGSGTCERLCQEQHCKGSRPNTGTCEQIKPKNMLEEATDNCPVDEHKAVPQPTNRLRSHTSVSEGMLPTSETTCTGRGRKRRRRGVGLNGAEARRSVTDQVPQHDLSLNDSPTEGKSLPSAALLGRQSSETLKGPAAAEQEPGNRGRGDLRFPGYGFETQLMYPLLARSQLERNKLGVDTNGGDGSAVTRRDEDGDGILSRAFLDLIHQFPDNSSISDSHRSHGSLRSSSAPLGLCNGCDDSVSYEDRADDKEESERVCVQEEPKLSSRISDNVSLSENKRYLVSNERGLQRDDTNLSGSEAYTLGSAKQKQPGRSNECSSTALPFGTCMSSPADKMRAVSDTIMPDDTSSAGDMALLTFFKRLNKVLNNTLFSTLAGGKQSSTVQGLTTALGDFQHSDFLSRGKVGNVSGPIQEEREHWGSKFFSEAPVTVDTLSDKFHATQLQEEARLAEFGVRGKTQRFKIPDVPGVFWDPPKGAWCALLSLACPSHQSSAEASNSGTTQAHVQYRSVKRKILCFRARWGSVASAKWNAVYERLKSNPLELRYLADGVRQDLARWITATAIEKSVVSASMATKKQCTERRLASRIRTVPYEANDRNSDERHFTAEGGSLSSFFTSLGENIIGGSSSIHNEPAVSYNVGMSPYKNEAPGYGESRIGRPSFSSASNTQNSNVPQVDVSTASSSPPARLADLLGSLAQALGLSHDYQGSATLDDWDGEEDRPSSTDAVASSPCPSIFNLPAASGTRQDISEDVKPVASHNRSSNLLSAGYNPASNKKSESSNGANYSPSIYSQRSVDTELRPFPSYVANKEAEIQHQEDSSNCVNSEGLFNLSRSGDKDDQALAMASVKCSSREEILVQDGHTRAKGCHEVMDTTQDSALQMRSLCYNSSVTGCTDVPEKDSVTEVSTQEDLVYQPLTKTNLTSGAAEFFNTSVKEESIGDENSMDRIAKARFVEEETKDLSLLAMQPIEQVLKAAAAKKGVEDTRSTSPSIVLLKKPLPLSQGHDITLGDSGLLFLLSTQNMITNSCKGVEQKFCGGASPLSSSSSASSPNIPVVDSSPLSSRNLMTVSQPVPPSFFSI